VSWGPRGPAVRGRCRAAAQFVGADERDPAEDERAAQELRGRRQLAERACANRTNVAAYRTRQAGYSAV
jgi:hypothetical protein